MKTRLSKLNLGSLHKRIIFLLFLFLLTDSVIWIDMYTPLTIPEIVITVTNFVLSSLAAVLVANIFLRLTVGRVYRMLGEDVEPEQAILMTKLYEVFLYVLACAYILWLAGVSIENITIFVGLASTGLAFAIRDILVSFIVWFVILTKRPFNLNDVVCIGEESGKVERISTFFITLVSHDGIVTKVPNKLFVEKPLQNLGAKTYKVSAILTFKKKPDLASIEEMIRKNKGNNVNMDIDAGENWKIKVTFTLPEEKMPNRYALVDKLSKISVK